MHGFGVGGFVGLFVFLLKLKKFKWRKNYLPFLYQEICTNETR